MTQSLPIDRIHHISHVTHDLEASRRFYRDILGFREISRPNFDFPGAWLYNYGTQVHLIQTPDKQAPEKHVATRVDHIAFHVNDIEEAEKLLKEHQIDYRSTLVADTNVTQLFFQDPDGNHIELGGYPPHPDVTA